MDSDKKETQFHIEGPVGKLQAALSLGDAEGKLFGIPRLAIICHPHPLHGGTMDNKVVTTLMRTYRDLGVSVLRFNFRGVGTSDGEFDQGIGELNDLMAIVSWATEKFPEQGIFLAGFSFGSSIAARASYSIAGVQHLTLIAPPIERYEFDCNKLFPIPVCVVQGDNDERVIAEGVYTWVKELRGAVKLIRYPDTGHFFHGKLAQLKEDLTHILLDQFAV